MIYGNNKSLKCPTSWWLQPIWKTLVKFGSFPQVGVKKKKRLKPPPRFGFCKLVATNQATTWILGLFFSLYIGTLFQGFLLRKAKLKRWRPLCGRGNSSPKDLKNPHLRSVQKLCYLPSCWFMNAYCTYCLQSPHKTLLLGNIIPYTT